MVKSPKSKIVVAIPAYNEQQFIGEVVSRASIYVDEVIVVDDGSTDRTAEIAGAAGATVIRHEDNRGYGEGIKSCFEVARENGVDVLVILDGDGQHNPDEIPQILAPILKNEAGLVIGSRFLSDHSSIPRYRKFGIGVITFLYNFGSKVKVSDAQSGFRAYNKKVLHALTLTEKGMGVSVEVLIIARRRGFQIKEFPITCVYHKTSSTLNPVRHGLGVALTVVRLRLKNEWLKRNERSKQT